MPLFPYTYVDDQTRQTVSGTIEADNEPHAYGILRQQGIFPTSLGSFATYADLRANETFLENNEVPQLPFSQPNHSAHCHYTALNPSTGEIVTGTLPTDDTAQAAEMLRQRGLAPQEIIPPPKEPDPDDVPLPRALAILSVVLICCAVAVFLLIHIQVVMQVVAFIGALIIVGGFLCLVLSG